MNDKIKVAVIGAGPAGMMAAGTAASMGADTTLFEKNEKPGRKLAITGKGRCNLTNNCDINEFIKHVPRNPRFLYAALNSFSPADTMEFFEELGVPLKTERGRRVFPVSDRAFDIVDALKKYCRDNGVKTKHAKVSGIFTENGNAAGIEHDGVKEYFDKIIVATGGLSYPTTGSDGDGYRFAEKLGINVKETYPSLVPLTAGSPCADLSGLTLKNVKFSLRNDKTGKNEYEEQGEMLFAHFGLTGPLVLSASAHMKHGEEYTAVIDFKPALDEKTLDNRLLSDFGKYKNRDMINAVVDLLPSALLPHVLRASGIEYGEKCNSLTKEKRSSLLKTLKGFEIKITGRRPIEEAIITSGGIDVKEIDPKTMQCKLVPGVYFCGEVLDLDAYTGGYNLQIAFSTGRAAGYSAALD